MRHRSPLTTLVLALLLVNALPAFVVLQAVPGRTKDWFVWTIQPDANARVLGVMYGNAFLLAAVAWLAPTWPRLRVAMAVVVPFSVAATIVTLVTLDPFLKHPRYELAYWLVNYGILCVAAPLTTVLEERKGGGPLPPEAPSTPAARVARIAASRSGMSSRVSPKLGSHICDSTSWRAVVSASSRANRPTKDSADSSKFFQYGSVASTERCGSAATESQSLTPCAPSVKGSKQIVFLPPRAAT